MQLTGLHHLTAVTARAADNLAFYTRVLGLRLVKKTVNQDDVSAYHLFYADGIAAPGTDLTFFDWAAPPERQGTDSISRTGLRVAGEAAFDWWREHLGRQGVTHHPAILLDGRLTLDFEDGEGQRLALVDDGGQGPAHPWAGSPVPPEHQIRGLGPVRLTVAAPERTEAVLVETLGMRRARTYELPEGEVRVFAMGAAGGGRFAGAEVHLLADRGAPARAGAGGVHHVAFRIPDADYAAWADRLKQRRMPSSGPVDRYYFRSLYFREPNGILFEIATDGPGFTADEPLESLGERLALPPFLEPRRAEIEAGLTPL